MGEFAYVIPSAPGDKVYTVCIDLVLLMGWVDSPKFFCAFLETLTDVANALVDTDLPVPSYGAVYKIPVIRPGPLNTPESLTHIYLYMNDVISVVQGGPYCQRRVFDGTVRALKWIFRLLLGELKDSVSVKKFVEGEGNWTCVKEVQWWIVDTEVGTVTLLERNSSDVIIVSRNQQISLVFWPLSCCSTTRQN